MRVHTVAAVICSAFLVSPASAASQIPIQKYNGTTTGRYIVQMKDGADRGSLQSLIIQTVEGQLITHDWNIINGFAGPFNAAALGIIRNSPHVKSVSEDGIMRISVVQTHATWGLRRISHPKPLPTGSSPSSLSYPYIYYPEFSGSGVDIYVVDTGVRITHKTFGKRAKWGETFGGYADADGNGHGTHVAGTAAGSDYGVAKAATVIAVKVLSDDGSGSVSDIVSGLNWVQEQAVASRRPSVVNMSLGGFLNFPLDSAVNALANIGVHVAVAAGNSGSPADFSSPARAAGAIAVAATDITDTRPSWSNWGLPVKIFTPGKDIISAWNTNDTATNQISGTSMASPHIAGLIAVFISRFGNRSPCNMTTLIQRHALRNVIRNVPFFTVNLLAQIPSSW